MVKYSDIQEAQEGKELLEDKRAEHKAMSILNDQMFQEEELVAKEEDNVSNMENEAQQSEIDIVAQEALQMMDDLQAQGKDPMVVLQQLPPEVQDKITQLLQDEQRQEEQPIQIQGEQDNAPQQNAMSSLTDMASSLAQ